MIHRNYNMNIKKEEFLLTIEELDNYADEIEDNSIANKLKYFAEKFQDIREHLREVMSNQDTQLDKLKDILY